MGKNSPYACFSHDDLILRDQLALDRTVLANERTVLAYERTATVLALTGLSIFKLFTDRLMHVVAILALSAAITLGIVGLVRFLKMRSSLSLLRR